MKNSPNGSLYIIVLSILFWTIVPCVVSQEIDTATSNNETGEFSDIDPQTLITLVTVIDSMADIENQLRIAKQSLLRTKLSDEQMQLESEIKELREKLVQYESDFQKIATSVDLDDTGEREIEKFDWTKEIQELLGPVIRELKGLTEKPRQIEKLKSDLEYHQKRLEPVEKALQNIELLKKTLNDESINETIAKQLAVNLRRQLQDDLIKAIQSDAKIIEPLKELSDEEKEAALISLVKNDLEKEVSQNLPSLIKKNAKELKKVKELIDTLADSLADSQQDIRNQITVVDYQLKEKEKEKKSVLESAQNLLRIFFKSRGRNLIFSLTVFVLTFLFFRFLHRILYAYSPLHRSEKRSLYVRIGDILYHIITVFGSISAMVIVLYVSGDWVLLIIVLLFLLGIAWAARQGIPKFWEQIKLLMNIGTVRENERVSYEGIPMKVESLNIYTVLNNPALQGGIVKLPIQNLTGMISRPHHESEPWFPSDQYDWVLLNDGVFGQVIVQTPDIVQLCMRGGSVKTYQTAEFLNQNPQNLSKNFRVSVVIGLDYSLQELVTSTIPEILCTAIADKLKLDGYEEHLIKVRADFREAAESSLNIVVFADFAGEIAMNYNKLHRLFQRVIVDTCTKQGWSIPYPQLTISKKP